MLDYQLDRHCSKTPRPVLVGLAKLDYQLDRHCSKTDVQFKLTEDCLITS